MTLELFSKEFWAQVEISDDSDACWLWRGKTRNVPFLGYGEFKGKQAHRIAFELFCGPIPKGIFACHKCDVKACVNPNHLFLGSPRENILDASRKGRLRYTPEQLTRQVNAQKKRWESRKARESSSAAHKELWKSGEYRAKTLAAIRAVSKTDAHRNIQCEATKLMWRYPLYRDKQSALKKGKPWSEKRRASEQARKARSTQP